MKIIQAYYTRQSWSSLKSLLSSLAILVLSTHCLFAQNGDANSDFGKFYQQVKAPSSPAFTILGTNPSEISRPKSYRALEASLLNSFFKNSELTFPSDFAIEFSPYWLASRPNLAFEEVYDPSPMQSALYSLSVSFASLGNSDNQDSTYLSLGVRTVFDFGKPRTTLEKLASLKKLKLLQQNVAFLSTFIDSFLNNEVQSFDGSNDDIKSFSSKLTTHIYTDPNLTSDQKDIANKYALTLIAKVKKDRPTSKDGVESIADEILTQDPGISNLDLVQQQAKMIGSAIEDRVGFKIELAAAVRNEFRNNTFSDNTSPTAGFWITPSYLHESLPIEFLGAFRYIRDNQDFMDETNMIDWTSNMDVGLKLIYHVNKFSLEGEFIYRTQTQVLEAQDSGNGFTTRPERKTIDRKFDLSVAYQLSENLAISYTYGKNFDLPILEGDLISALNLNFGIGGYKTSDK